MANSSLYDLLAKTQNKDVSCLFESCLQTFLGILPSPKDLGPSHREKAVYDDSHLASLFESQSLYIGAGDEALIFPVPEAS